MKNYKILALSLCTLLTLPLVGCQNSDNSEISEEESAPVSPRSITYDWQDLYEGKIREFMSSEMYSAEDSGDVGKSMFDIHDLDSDGVPELIISPDTSTISKAQIYTVSENALISVGEIGNDGIFDFLPQQNLIHSEYEGQGFILGRYAVLEHSEITDFLTYSDNSSSASTGAVISHEINGEEVTLMQYKNTFAEYNAYTSFEIGRKYTFGDGSIDYALHCSENWFSVLTDEQKQLCKDKLTELASQNIEGSAFEFCDLNSDETPELIVTTPDSAFIYYFGEDTLSQLDGSYSDGSPLFLDIDNKVFYYNGTEGTVYWSMASEEFSAQDYTSSGNIVEFGKKYILTEDTVLSLMG